MRAKNIFFILPKTITSLCLASLVSLTVNVPVSDAASIEPSLSPIGNYLVGRHAESERDLSVAADFLKAVLDQSPGTPDLLRRTFVLLVMVGRIKEALPMAKQLQKTRPQDTITNLVLATNEFKNKNLNAVTKRLRSMSNTGLSGLSTPILLGWALTAQKKIDEGLAALKALEKEKASLALHDLYKGLILDFAGRTLEAQKAYEDLIKRQGMLSFRQTQLIGNFYERSSNIKAATRLYDQYQEQNPDTSLLYVARARLRLKVTPKPLIASATDGVAEVLFWIANSLRRQHAQETKLLLAQLALHIKPNYPIMRILTGEILEADQRFEDANFQFNNIPESSTFKQTAQMRIAANYHDMGRTNEAIAIARGVAKSRPYDPKPHHAVGDYLRSTEYYKEAIPEYDEAIRRAGALKSTHWRLFYKRGIVLERVKAFKESEADFLKALELQPDQPFVLNYLGYSWIEQGRNLSKAQDMIRKAVNLRPNDGYIIDSLGWVYYQIGNYDDAVAELERAVQYRPEDPVINDHLGDAYWQVGRKNEARFQWLHSLSLEPDKEVEKRVRGKLKNGLKPIPKSVIKNELYTPKTKG
jgi:tetratricopeptide (TPR) repeat protein